MAAKAKLPAQAVPWLALPATHSHSRLLILYLWCPNASQHRRAAARNVRFARKFSAQVAAHSLRRYFIADRSSGGFSLCGGAATQNTFKQVGLRREELREAEEKMIIAAQEAAWRLREVRARSLGSARAHKHTKRQLINT